MVFPLTFELPECITSVNIKPTQDGAPANSYLDGELILDPSFFKLPTDYQYFIVCHEAGHIATQSKSEQDADNYGFHLYIQSGRSLKALVGALADVLTFTSPEHLQRTKQMLARCLNYDKQKNNNMTQSIQYSDNSNSLYGWTPLKNLQERFERKQDRKDSLADAKALKKILTGEARLKRAQGGAPGIGEQITGALGALGSGAANILGGGANNAPVAEPSFFEKNKTAIIVTVVVVVVAVVAFVFIRRKK